MTFFRLKTHFLQLSGEKTAQLLHGQLTHHILSLEIGKSQSNLFLTQKGKVVCEVEVLRLAEFQFLLAISEIGFDSLKEKLLKVAPLSKVQIEDLSGSYQAYRVFDKSLADDFKLKGRDRSESVDIYVDAHQKLPEMSFLEKENLRLQHLSPEIGIDFDENNLPQEARLDHCLNFEKGCYLGQEIIARLHFRGHVNKLLSHLKIMSENPESLFGKEIFKEQKKVGVITSSVYFPEERYHLALGYLPYKMIEDGNVDGVVVEGMKVEIL